MGTRTEVGEKIAGEREEKLYFRTVDPESRGEVAAAAPVCLYLEVSNECNLTCKTCPLTYGKAEAPAALTFEQVRRLVSRFPEAKQVVLHGVGEPLLNRELPRMIRWLKERGIYVLFNTNGTLLNPRRQEALIDGGLDEVRVSLDAADAETFARVRGKPLFDVILRNLKSLGERKRARRARTPAVSLWLTGLRETIRELPDFVRLAGSLGIERVHLQRLVYWQEGHAAELATSEQSLFNSLREEEEEILAAAHDLAAELGVRLEASGAGGPAASLAGGGERPWSACMRPWTLMYISARGSCFPCCIAPFSTADLKGLSLGNAFAEDPAALWNGERYREFRRRLLGADPPECCRGCGSCWSL